MERKAIKALYEKPVSEEFILELSTVVLNNNSDGQSTGDDWEEVID